MKVEILIRNAIVKENKTLTEVAKHLGLHERSLGRSLKNGSISFNNAIKALAYLGVEVKSTDYKGRKVILKHE